MEASELLKLPIIQKTINELDLDRLTALKLTGERVLKRIDDVYIKAIVAKDLSNALRALELMGRNKLWEKGGGGVKSILSNPDGTMRIMFNDDLDVPPCESK